jgi:PPOX class probable F420-dependent enzyme
METTTLAAARIRRFLEREPVVWLSTVRPDGGPHLVPIWFSWDGEALLIVSKPDAQKVRNMRENASVMLALGDVENDFDIGLIEGRAELLDRPSREVLPASHFEKYAERLAAIGMSPDDYVATYSQVIRIVPNDFLGWHGLTTPTSKRLLGAPAVSIAEPRRDEHVAATGEPLGRRRPPITPRIVQPVRVREATTSRLGAAFGRHARALTGSLNGPLRVGAA